MKDLQYLLSAAGQQDLMKPSVPVSDVLQIAINCIDLYQHRTVQSQHRQKCYSIMESYKQTYIDASKAKREICKLVGNVALFSDKTLRVL